MTRDTYDSVAEEWVRAHPAGGFWSEQMAAFHGLLPRGRILEFGSGGGRDAKELIALGYGYVGTDISSSLLQIAQRENPGATFIETDVCTLSLSEGDLFDGFWASAVLLYIPKRRVNEALSRIRGSVREGGIGFISLKQGKGEAVQERLLEGRKDSRFFAYYSEEEFTAILERNGFEVVEVTRRLASETTWLCFLVRVAAEGGGPHVPTGS